MTYNMVVVGVGGMLAWEKQRQDKNARPKHHTSTSLFQLLLLFFIFTIYEIITMLCDKNEAFS